VGKPVQVPIKHLSIASNFKRKKFDTEAIHVYVSATPSAMRQRG
jgi:hypothetical protein